MAVEPVLSEPVSGVVFPANREFTGNICSFSSIWPVSWVFFRFFQSDYNVLLSNSLLFKEQGIYCEEQGNISAEQGRKLAEQGRGLLTRH